MAISSEFDALRTTLEALRGHGVIPGVAERLGAGQGQFTTELGSTMPATPGTRSVAVRRSTPGTEA